MLLKEFITQVRGVSYKPNNILGKGMGIPILRANNIKDGKINLDDLIYIDKAVIKKEQILKSGDIVLCTSSGSKDLVGKAGTFNGNEHDISFGAFCKVVRVIDCDKINKDFIRLFFQSPTYKKQIADSSIGANINNIKTEHIDNLSICIPSIKAQNIAVKEINVLIESIDGLEKKLSYFDELIKSRFIEMFRDCKIKKPLEELTTKITDGSHNPPKGIEKSKFLMLSSQNVHNELDLTDVRYLTKEDFELENKRTDVQQGDVLLTIVGTIGRTHVVKENEKYTFQRSVGVIKPKNNILNGTFLSTYLHTEEAINQLESGGHGSSQKGIYLKDVKKLLIPVPEYRMQLEFEYFVELIDKSKFVVQQQINALQELLDRKMDEYFGTTEGTL